VAGRQRGRAEPWTAPLPSRTTTAKISGVTLPLPPAVRVSSFDRSEFPLDRLLDEKGDHSVAVVIPARNEEATVAGVVSTIARELLHRVGLLDELVVVDDGSTDATARRARAAGARVVPSAPPSRDGSPASIGKGGAMRRGLAVTASEIVVFLDADVTDLRQHFVTGLLGPLLCADGFSLVKGAYLRPIGGSATGGGRVTELVAKPLLSLLHPGLVGVEQPLAGESAAPRRVLESVGLADGYGVEIALLIDVAERFGAGSIAQVDLGSRSHRNRSLGELAFQAREVMASALARTGIAAP
jgi:glucosyl-3-phosphoglycerate synthase